MTDQNACGRDPVSQSILIETRTKNVWHIIRIRTIFSVHYDSKIIVFRGGSIPAQAEAQTDIIVLIRTPI